jgi:hypothetical protein
VLFFISFIYVIGKLLHSQKNSQHSSGIDITHKVHNFYPQTLSPNVNFLLSKKLLMDAILTAIINDSS